MTDQQRPDQKPTGDSASAVAYGAAGDHGAGLDAEEGPTFLADLAHAMQVTAAAQRLRITEAADERRQAHIDAIRGRETAQSEELREVADADVKGIEGWATAEIERIRLERQRRIAARKTELERRLEQHHMLIEQEIAAVEAAVVAYRDEVDRFFGRLDLESDPIAIAREAGNLPPFPVLEVIGPEDAPNAPAETLGTKVAQTQQGSGAAPTEAEATQGEPVAERDEDHAPDAGEGADAEAGVEATGVVDEQAGEPIAVGEAAAASAGEPVAASAGEVADASGDGSALIGVLKNEAPAPVAVAVAPSNEHPEPATDDAATAGDSGGDAAATEPDADTPAAENELDEGEPLVGAGPKVTPRSSGAIIQSVPSLRPIGSWLRRSNNSNDRN